MDHLVGMIVGVVFAIGIILLLSLVLSIPHAILARGWALLSRELSRRRDSSGS